jgi:hypothetical protein
MNKHRLVTAGTSALLVGMALGYLSSGAHAAGIPTSNALTYSGVLTDLAGTPLTGMKKIQVSLFNRATADGTVQCTAGPETKTLVAGGFQIDLAACAKTIGATPDLWVEVFVDGASLGRSKLGAVPFAFETAHATASDSASAASGALDSRIGALEASVAQLRAGLGPLLQTGAFGAGYTQADWTLHMGTGARSLTKRINFAEPFAKAPQVTLGIVNLDVDQRLNTRVGVTATAIDTTGFTLTIATWGDTLLYGTTVNWTAFLK